MYGAEESWALTGSQAAQLETFHNSCMRRMLGRYRGTGGPSTTELLEVTRQMPISQLLRRHMVGWLGRRSPQAGDHHRQPTAACRLHPGAPKACRPPHYKWKDGTMQDLNALGPQLQLDLLRDWPKLALDRELWRGVASRASRRAVGACRHQPT